ncbi:MAG: ATP-dependent Clp protease proteolytic subunit [Verrucomicrobia bacterium]|nr:ATP-dependent Clp protease proteolytic subunit [Verrucomicrobiota bacterium]
MTSVTLGWGGEEPAAMSATPGKVFVLPIREEIMPPLLYLVRRGVKAAMEAEAEWLVLDMNTPGGRLDTCRDIIAILGRFPGRTVTYVNRDAFSAGAFIAVATQRIYMAPESVIGAAAPVLLSPGGEGVMQIPDTYEKKMVSAVRAMVRATAEKNGYNVEVVEAMIDKDKGLKVGDVVIAKPGEILTLTNTEAEREYGHPPKRLLSSGTAASLEALLETLGQANAERHTIAPTGMEQVGFWLNKIAPLLLIIGIVGFYIEFKTPGFGAAGIIGLVALALYFLGSHAAGLSGMEWVLVFIIGVVLVALEIFVFPGTMALGIGGASLMLIAVIMAAVDMYPGMPNIPSLPQLRLPMRNLSLAVVGSALAIAVLSRVLPRTPIYRTLVSEGASGMQTEFQQQAERSSLLGQVGVTISNLRPGGKAQFGEQIVDVISQGDLLAKGTRVRIIDFSAREAVVEPVTDA